MATIDPTRPKMTFNRQTTRPTVDASASVEAVSVETAQEQPAVQEVMETAVQVEVVETKVEAVEVAVAMETPVVVVPVVDANTALVMANISNPEFAKACAELVKKNPAAMVYLNELFDYAKAMRPNNINSEEDGMRWQIRLYKVMTNLLKYNGEQYNVLLLCVLNFFHQHQDACFEWSYRNRFMENIALSAPERKAFTAMTFFFTEFCVPEHTERTKRAKMFLTSRNMPAIQSIIGEEAMQRVRTALRFN